MKEINKPEQLTYVIAYDDNKLNPVYFYIESDQTFSTGKKNLYKTIYKDEWMRELRLNFNIIY